MSVLDRIRAIFSPRPASLDEALALSFGSLDRWLISEESTRQFAFLQMFAEVPVLLQEWRDEYRNDIRQIFVDASTADQKVRLRRLTIARVESLILNRAYRSRDESERRILAVALVGQGEPFEETEAISAVLVARAECTCMLARQLQKHLFGDVAPHDYLGAFREAHELYVDTLFDITLKGQVAIDASVERMMLKPLRQMVDQIKADAFSGSDRRYPPRGKSGAG